MKIASRDLTILSSLRRGDNSAGVALKHCICAERDQMNGGVVVAPQVPQTTTPLSPLRRSRSFRFSCSGITEALSVTRKSSSGTCRRAEFIDLPFYLLRF